MGLFSKKKKEEDKKTDDKPVKVDDGKKSMKDLYGDKKPDKSSKVENEKEAKKLETKKGGNAYKILIKPLITEKASRQGTENKYFFEAAKGANKIEIAKAVNEVYGVRPVSVNIINMIGKKARHGRISGKRKDWKKAIVELKKGESIKIYEGV